MTLINSTAYITAMLSIVSATLPAHSMQVNFDLALLNQHLAALNQNITNKTSQPVSVEAKVTAADIKAIAAQPMPTLPMEPMDQKTVAALQQFIDFNRPTYQPFTLNNTINDLAPKMVPVKISDNALLIQLLTAWQDFRLQAFLESQEGIKDAKQTLEDELDYRNATNMVKLFKFYSQFPPDQQSALKDQKKDIYLGGGDASCGYHAIKNLLVMTSLIFAQGATPKDYFMCVGLLLNLSITNALFGAPLQFQTITKQTGMGVWRQAIIEELNKHKAAGKRDDLISQDNGEWLDNVGILWLFNAIKNNRLPTGLPQQQNSAVLNALQNENFIVEIYRGKGISSQLKIVYARNTNFTGAYFVEIQMEGRPSHWFTLMINKKDRQTQFIILDSKNRPNYSPEHPEHNGGRQVIDIINSLTTVDADDILRAVKPSILKSEELKAAGEKQAEREAAARRDEELARLLSTGMNIEEARRAISAKENKVNTERKAQS